MQLWSGLVWSGYGYVFCVCGTKYINCLMIKKMVKNGHRQKKHALLYIRPMDYWLLVNLSWWWSAVLVKHTVALVLLNAIGHGIHFTLFVLFFLAAFSWLRKERERERKEN